MRSLLWFPRVYRCVLLAVVASVTIAAQESSSGIGGSYSELGERRRQLVDDWVVRFTQVTGQRLDARSFYDDILSLSTKTTFDAVTHALVTTPMTDASGQQFSDGLALIERVDTVTDGELRNIVATPVRGRAAREPAAMAGIAN